jgi:hypothetical protein
MGQHGESQTETDIQLSETEKIKEVGMLYDDIIEFFAASNYPPGWSNVDRSADGSAYSVIGENLAEDEGNDGLIEGLRPDLAG